jgi:hypothetical protein
MKRTICTCVLGLSLVLALGPFALTRNAIAQDITVIPQPVPGSCSYLKDYIQTHGVVDPDGKSHPGGMGITSIKANCKPEKNPFMNPHEVKPDGPKRVCYQATASFTCSFHLTTTILQWEPLPDACDSRNCQAAIDAWQKSLKEHEELHQKVDEAELNFMIQEFQGFDVQGCTAKRKGVTWKAVEPQFDAQVAAKEASFKQELAKKNKKIDAIPQPPPTFCSICQQPPLCKPLTACDGQLPDTSFANCGWSDAGQIVACCDRPGYPEGVCSPLHNSGCDGFPPSASLRYDWLGVDKILITDSGERGRNRTFNLLIKSQMLYQVW